MIKSNHYEKAFEAYLRDRRLGYVAVDESRRTKLADESVKSIDFIVTSDRGIKLLVDIKGRKFPNQSRGKPTYTWQNWVSESDVVGLDRWHDRFGPEYLPVFVFMYLLSENVELQPGTDDLWVWKGERYLVRAIPVADYRAFMKPRSPRWQTVHLPTQAYRELVRPLRDFTHPPHEEGHGELLEPGHEPDFRE